MPSWSRTGSEARLATGASGAAAARPQSGRCVASATHAWLALTLAPQDIAKETAQGLVILFILERLYLTRPVSWMEDHIDYLSCQALFFRHSGLSLLQQTKLLYSYKRRISDN